MSNNVRNMIINGLIADNYGGDNSTSSYSAKASTMNDMITFFNEVNGLDENVTYEQAGQMYYYTMNQNSDIDGYMPGSEMRTFSNFVEMNNAYGITDQEQISNNYFTVRNAVYGNQQYANNPVTATNDTLFQSTVGQSVENTTPGMVGQYAYAKQSKSPALLNSLYTDAYTHGINQLNNANIAVTDSNSQLNSADVKNIAKAEFYNYVMNGGKLNDLTNEVKTGYNTYSAINKDVSISDFATKFIYQNASEIASYDANTNTIIIDRSSILQSKTGKYDPSFYTNLNRSIGRGGLTVPVADYYGNITYEQRTKKEIEEYIGERQRQYTTNNSWFYYATDQDRKWFGNDATKFSLNYSRTSNLLNSVNDAKQEYLTSENQDIPFINYYAMSNAGMEFLSKVNSDASTQHEVRDNRTDIVSQNFGQNTLNVLGDILLPVTGTLDYVIQGSYYWLKDKQYDNTNSYINDLVSNVTKNGEPSGYDTLLVNSLSVEQAQDYFTQLQSLQEQYNNNKQLTQVDYLKENQDTLDPVLTEALSSFTDTSDLTKSTATTAINSAIGGKTIQQKIDTKKSISNQVEELNNQFGLTYLENSVNIEDVLKNGNIEGYYYTYLYQHAVNTNDEVLKNQAITYYNNLQNEQEQVFNQWWSDLSELGYANVDKTANAANGDLMAYETGADKVGVVEGIVANLALDPTTYLTGGSSSILKAFGYTGDAGKAIKGVEETTDTVKAVDNVIKSVETADDLSTSTKSSVITKIKDLRDTTTNGNLSQSDVISNIRTQYGDDVADTISSQIDVSNSLSKSINTQLNKIKMTDLFLDHNTMLVETKRYLDNALNDYDYMMKTVNDMISSDSDLISIGEDLTNNIQNSRKQIDELSIFGTDMVTQINEIKKLSEVVDAKKLYESDPKFVKDLYKEMKDTLYKIEDTFTKDLTQLKKILSGNNIDFQNFVNYIQEQELILRGTSPKKSYKSLLSKYGHMNMTKVNGFIDNIDDIIIKMGDVKDRTQLVTLDSVNNLLEHQLYDEIFNGIDILKNGSFRIGNKKLSSTHIKGMYNNLARNSDKVATLLTEYLKPEFALGDYTRTVSNRAELFDELSGIILGKFGTETHKRFASAVTMRLLKNFDGSIYHNIGPGGWLLKNKYLDIPDNVKKSMSNLYAVEKKVKDTSTTVSKNKRSIYDFGDLVLPKNNKSMVQAITDSTRTNLEEFIGWLADNDFKVDFEEYMNKFNLLHENSLRSIYSYLDDELTYIRQISKNKSGLNRLTKTLKATYKSDKNAKKFIALANSVKPETMFQSEELISLIKYINNKTADDVFKDFLLSDYGKQLDNATGNNLVSNIQDYLDPFTHPDFGSDIEGTLNNVFNAYKLETLQAYTENTNSVVELIRKERTDGILKNIASKPHMLTDKQHVALRDEIASARYDVFSSNVKEKLINKFTTEHSHMYNQLDKLNVDSSTAKEITETIETMKNKIRDFNTKGFYDQQQYGKVGNLLNKVKIKRFTRTNEDMMNVLIKTVGNVKSDTVNLHNKEQLLHLNRKAFSLPGSYQQIDRLLLNKMSMSKLENTIPVNRIIKSLIGNDSNFLYTMSESEVNTLFNKLKQFKVPGENGELVKVGDLVNFNINKKSDVMGDYFSVFLDDANKEKLSEILDLTPLDDTNVEKSKKSTEISRLAREIFGTDTINLVSESAMKAYDHKMDIALKRLFKAEQEAGNGDIVYEYFKNVQSYVKKLNLSQYEILHKVDGIGDYLRDTAYGEVLSRLPVKEDFIPGTNDFDLKRDFIRSKFFEKLGDGSVRSNLSRGVKETKIKGPSWAHNNELKQNFGTAEDVLEYDVISYGERMQKQITDDGFTANIVRDLPEIIRSASRGKTAKKNIKRNMIELSKDDIKNRLLPNITDRQFYRLMDNVDKKLNLGLDLDMNLDNFKALEYNKNKLNDIHIQMPKSHYNVLVNSTKLADVMGDKSKAFHILKKMSVLQKKLMLSGTFTSKFFMSGPILMMMLPDSNLAKSMKYYERVVSNYGKFKSLSSRQNVNVTNMLNDLSQEIDFTKRLNIPKKYFTGKNLEIAEDFVKIQNLKSSSSIHDYVDNLFFEGGSNVKYNSNRYFYDKVSNNNTKNMINNTGQRIKGVVLPNSQVMDNVTLARAMMLLDEDPSVLKRLDRQYQGRIPTLKTTEDKFKTAIGIAEGELGLDDGIKGDKNSWARIVFPFFDQMVYGMLNIFASYYQNPRGLANTAKYTNHIARINANMRDESIAEYLSEEDIQNVANLQLGLDISDSDRLIRLNYYSPWETVDAYGKMITKPFQYMFDNLSPIISGTAEVANYMINEDPKRADLGEYANQSSNISLWAQAKSNNDTQLAHKYMLNHILEKTFGNGYRYSQQAYNIMRGKDPSGKTLVTSPYSTDSTIRLANDVRGKLGLEDVSNITIDDIPFLGSLFDSVLDETDLSQDIDDMNNFIYETEFMEDMSGTQFLNNYYDSLSKQELMDYMINEKNPEELERLVANTENMNPQVKQALLEYAEQLKKEEDNSKK